MNSPSGRPASWKTRAMIKPPATEVRRSGFKTTALPKAKAGAVARMDKSKGTLKGEMTPITPRGTRVARLILGKAEGSTSPGGCEAMAAASIVKLIVC